MCLGSSHPTECLSSSPSSVSSSIFLQTHTWKGSPDCYRHLSSESADGRWHSFCLSTSLHLLTLTTKKTINHIIYKYVKFMCLLKTYEKKMKGLENACLPKVCSNTPHPLFPLDYSFPDHPSLSYCLFLPQNRNLKGNSLHKNKWQNTKCSFYILYFSYISAIYL